jgi:hypothetical protein
VDKSLCSSGRGRVHATKRVWRCKPQAALLRTSQMGVLKAACSSMCGCVGVATRVCLSGRDRVHDQNSSGCGDANLKQSCLVRVVLLWRHHLLHLCRQCVCGTTLLGAFESFDLAVDHSRCEEATETRTTPRVPAVEPDAFGACQWVRVWNDVWERV